MRRLALLAALVSACSRAAPPTRAVPTVSGVETGPGLIEALSPRGEALVLANFWATW